MIRTIQISSAISAQGVVTGTLPDGRLQIDAGGRTLTGFPLNTASTSVR